MIARGNGWRLATLRALAGEVAGETGEGGARVEARLPAAALERLCEGHFPGDPVVPGAHLLGCLVDVLGEATGEAAGWAVERCVFRAPVRPSEAARARVREGARGRWIGEIVGDAGEGAAATAWFVRGEGARSAGEERDEGAEGGGGALTGAEIAGLLRHRGPALLIAREVGAAGVERRFVTAEAALWHWTQLLDALAQAAGLCLRGEAPELVGAAVVVAAYEGVRGAVGGALAPGSVRIGARRLRRFLGMQQFECVATSAGEVVLAARVTLAGA